MKKITITEQTCEACPSAWDVILPDGKPGYIRYRWGWIALKPVTERAGIFQEAIISEQIGDEYDGTISLADAVRWLEKQGYEVDYSNVKTRSFEP